MQRDGVAQTSERMHFTIHVEGKDEIQCEQLLKEQLDWIHSNRNLDSAIAPVVHQNLDSAIAPVHQNLRSAIVPVHPINSTQFTDTFPIFIRVGDLVSLTFHTVNLRTPVIQNHISIVQQLPPSIAQSSILSVTNFKFRIESVDSSKSHSLPLGLILNERTGTICGSASEETKEPLHLFIVREHLNTVPVASCRIQLIFNIVCAKKHHLNRSPQKNTNNKLPNHALFVSCKKPLGFVRLPGPVEPSVLDKPLQRRLGIPRHYQTLIFPRKSFSSRHETVPAFDHSPISPVSQNQPVESVFNHHSIRFTQMSDFDDLSNINLRPPRLSFSGLSPRFAQSSSLTQQRQQQQQQHKTTFKPRWSYTQPKKAEASTGSITRGDAPKKEFQKHPHDETPPVTVSSPMSIDSSPHESVDFIPFIQLPPETRRMVGRFADSTSTAGFIDEID